MMSSHTAISHDQNAGDGDGDDVAEDDRQDLLVMTSNSESTPKLLLNATLVFVGNRLLRCRRIGAGRPRQFSPPFVQTPSLRLAS